MAAHPVSAGARHGRCADSATAQAQPAVCVCVCVWPRLVLATLFNATS
jgi:hypothetical protein